MSNRLLTCVNLIYIIVECLRLTFSYIIILLFFGKSFIVIDNFFIISIWISICVTCILKIKVTITVKSDSYYIRSIKVRVHRLKITKKSRTTNYNSIIPCRRNGLLRKLHKYAILICSIDLEIVGLRGILSSIVFIRYCYCSILGIFTKNICKSRYSTLLIIRSPTSIWICPCHITDCIV